MQLPGGRDNIGNPDYDLKNETSLAPRSTLMRVARYEKQPDNGQSGSRAGAVPRGAALRNMPYARADVRIIPDGEASRTSRTSAFRVLVRGATRGRGLRAGRVPAAAGVGRRGARVSIDVAAATAGTAPVWPRLRGAAVGRADARNAADAADDRCSQTRARRRLSSTSAAAFSVSPTAVPSVSNSRAPATGRRLARGLCADGRRRAVWRNGAAGSGQSPLRPPAATRRTAAPRA